MIHFPRSLAKEFLQVARKAGLHKPVRSHLTACVRLIAERETLTLHAMDFRLSVAWVVPIPNQPATLIVPLALLANCSQRTDGDVTLAVRQGRVVAQWIDHGLPIKWDYDLIELDQMPPVPVVPTVRSENPPKLLEALRDAMRSTDPESARFALGCVQLCGADGRIDATDGGQALIQRGFQFPWAENVLVPASKVFESAVLPRDVDVQIGRTEHQVVLTVGSWTIALDIQTEGKFPDILKIVPALSAVQTRLQLDLSSFGQLAEKMLTVFLAHDLAQPAGAIIGIEKELRSRLIDDVPDLLARLDLVIDQPEAVLVTDFKTSRSRWSPADVETASGQILLYGELLRLQFDRPVKLQFAVLTKTKQPDLQIHEVASDAGPMARQRALIRRVWRSIQGGHFYPHPSAMNCPTCPFQTACRDWTG